MPSGAYTGKVRLMHKRIRKWARWVLMAGAGSCVLQAECIRDIQREIDLLYRPEANLAFVRESVLVDLFGPEILAPLDF